MNILLVGANLVVSIPLLWVAILFACVVVWGLVFKRGDRSYRS